MPKIPAVPIEEFKSVLTYHPETGHFYWSKTVGKKFKEGMRAGGVRNREYRAIGYKFTRIFEHRLAWAFCHGFWPPLDVDHINGNKGDNRIANLRLATRSQNVAYKPVKNQSRTKVKGVYWDKRDGRYYPYLDMNGRRKSLGGFSSLEAAAKAREDAEREFWKEFSWSSTPHLLPSGR